MKKQLETREYSLKNGLILKGVVDADSGKIYFPIQALAKAVGYSVDQAKGFKKLVLRGVSPPNRSKTLIRNFSPVQELGIKDFLAVFS